MTPSRDSNPVHRIRHSLTAHRSRHRSAAHASAHADDTADLPPLPDHLSVPIGNPILVQSDDELTEMISAVRAAGRFAYDSEFIGESTYHPQLCLVQVATDRDIWLIDPLLPVDLKPFWDLVIDPSLLKIVHAGEQDLEPATRHTGKPCSNVFDTQIAAGFAHMAYPVALAKLVSALLGVQLAKALTFTQWDARPLTGKQLRYAADDVRYLCAVYDALKLRIGQSPRWQYVLDECASRCRPDRWTVDVEIDAPRVRGAGTLDGRGFAILKRLFIWRDQAALQDNLPPRALLKDETLIDLARRHPKTIERLRDIRGIPRPVIEQHGPALLQHIADGLSQPVAPMEKLIDPTPVERFQIDALHAAAHLICATQGIDAALAATRNDVAEFFRARTEGQSIDALPLMQGWRAEVVGRPLVEFLKGKSLHADAGSLRAGGDA